MTAGVMEGNTRAALVSLVSRRGLSQTGVSACVRADEWGTGSGRTRALLKLRWNFSYQTSAQTRRLTLPRMPTTMSCSSPPEIIDLIIDHLYNEPTTLETCCIVSKSWVPRARKHLFAHVEFHASKSHMELWKETFPDPSNSPAHHTRSLSIYGIPVVAPTDAGVGGWIRAFHNVVHLRLERLGEEDPRASFVPFYGFSPTVRSLSLASTSLEVFDLVCSFPLLEDLALHSLHPTTQGDGWVTPSTSPKLTGSLYLKTIWEVHSVTRRLCALPDGLRFTGITVAFTIGNTEPITDLVSKCSGTLESLSINCFLGLGTFASVSVIGQYLTVARGYRNFYDTFPRSFQGSKTQRSELSVEKDECPVDHHGTQNRRIQKASAYHHLPSHRRQHRGSSFPGMA